MSKIEDPDRDAVKQAADSLKSSASPQALTRGLGFSVSAKAREMLAAGYRGEGVRGGETFDYIVIAASNENIEEGMDERVYAWWWIVNLKFESWKAKKKLGIAIESEDVL